MKFNFMNRFLFRAFCHSPFLVKRSKLTSGARFDFIEVKTPEIFRFSQLCLFNFLELSRRIPHSFYAKAFFFHLGNNFANLPDAYQIEVMHGSGSNRVQGAPP